ncbi:MAG: DNA-packaging protein, partial [Rhodobacteraceae bacterium]|nr:DNA-packaging protein [Paracoccaceae bacterium]
VEGAGPLDAGLCRNVALIGETIDQTREVMVFGESGLIACCPPDRKPEWQATRKRLLWPNGAVAQVFSASDPESLRGPQFDCAWVDGLAKWKRGQDTWDMLQFALRLGDNPRQVVTTTPRNNRLLREILDDGATVKTSAPTSANRANLASSFLKYVTEKYKGTRLGRQELNGELLTSDEGALWTLEALDEGRVSDVGAFSRIVAAVDPPVTTGKSADTCGIVVAGVYAEGAPTTWRSVVLADASIQGASPQQWAAHAVRIFHEYGADRLVAEVNQGGELVESLIRQIDPLIAYRAVRASRGKVARAEPVAALYEQGRVAHLNGMPELEDQMCQFTAQGFTGRASPDRVDAMVWAITDLMIDPAKVFLAPKVRGL